MSIEVAASSQHASQNSEKRDKLSKEEKRAQREEKKRRHEAEIEESSQRPASKKLKTSNHESARPAENPRFKKPKPSHSKRAPETPVRKPSSKKSKPSHHEPKPELEQGPLDSPFFVETRSFYLPLPPIASRHPLDGLCAEHLAPLILTYHRKMKGVVLAYNQPFLSGDPGIGTMDHPEVFATCVNEYAASFAWVTADFLLFRPTPGMWIEGYVTIQNEGHLGLLCLNLFNASIARSRMPTEWNWKGSALPVSPGRQANGRGRSQGHDEDEDTNGSQADVGDVREVTEDEGYWENSRGKRVEGALRFRVIDLIVSRPGDRDKGFFGIEGSLLTEK